MANNAPRDGGFIASVSARPYVRGKLGGVAFLAVPEGLHVIVVSYFEFRFTEAKVIFGLVVAVYGGFVLFSRHRPDMGHGVFLQLHEGGSGLSFFSVKILL